MQSKTIHEEEILNDVQNLPEFMQEELVKVVHF